MRLIRSLSLLCLVVVVCAEAPLAPELTPGPGDIVEQDDWLNGYMDRQPLANMHVVTIRHEDGTRSTLSNTAIVFKRDLAGLLNSKFIINENNLYRENSDGYLTNIEIHQEENGARSVAIAHVNGRQVDAVIHRPTGEREQTIELPEGVQLMGMEASQRAMARADLKVGDSMKFHVLGLLAGELHLMTVTAALLENINDDTGRYRMTIDRIPNMPMHAVVDKSGTIHSMDMNFGPMRFDFQPGDGPLALTGAELAMVGLVTHRGPPPATAAENRYRLPEKSRHLIPQDAFQTFDDNGVMTIRSIAEVLPLENRELYLQEEPQIEISAEEIRAWVAKTLIDIPNNPTERARVLTQAVRNYLHGDLSRGEASALEAFRTRRGDCTEHANLLVAALRIAGIPARVDVGFVYAGTLGGWGGHAWTAAYDDQAGQWIHLDAAYPGIPRSCYIRTGSSTGQAKGTNNLLDRGMSLVLGETIEVLAEE